MTQSVARMSDTRRRTGESNMVPVFGVMIANSSSVPSLRVVMYHPGSSAGRCTLYPCAAHCMASTKEMPGLLVSSTRACYGSWPLDSWGMRSQSLATRSP